MYKLLSAFHEFPKELVTFVSVFLFHFSFLGNVIAVFSIPGGGFPPTSFKCPGEGAVITPEKHWPF